MESSPLSPDEHRCDCSDRLATAEAERAEMVALLEEIYIDEDPDQSCGLYDHEPCGLLEQYAPCLMHKKVALIAKLKGGTP